MASLEHADAGPTATIHPAEPEPSLWQSRGIRRHAARGTIINAVFVVGVAVLGLAQKIVVAALLTPAEFGIWSLVLMALLMILFIKNAGVAERFVQQDARDQERAFQEAFAVELLLSLACTALIAVSLPIFALAYGQQDVIAPGLVLSLAVLFHGLQAPVWIFYRRMDFRRQRIVQALDPVVSFVVTVSLAIAGAGYWSLVLGAVAGSAAAGVTALAMAPYRLGLRLSRASISDYFRFSWPVAVANGSSVAVGQLTQLVGVRSVGVRGVGAIGLGGSLTAFSDGVDGIVTQTIYPAICRVRDQRELLHEAFVKTNRLALMWGVPFGTAVVLFSPALVDHVLGQRWSFGVLVLQAFGAKCAIDQLGFNWHAFMRALDKTRPLAVVGLTSLAAFGFVTVPLLIVFDLKGFAAGLILWSVITVAARTVFLRKIFPSFRMSVHAARAMMPVLPAVLAVLAIRFGIDDSSSVALIALQLVTFSVLVVIATALFERRLLAEMLGYLRRA